MAIIETKKEPRNYKGILLGLVVVLGLAGIGFGMYEWIKGPRRRIVTLTGEAAKQAQASADVPPGSAMPPPPPLPQATDPGATMVTLDLQERHRRRSHRSSGQAVERRA